MHSRFNPVAALFPLLLLGLLAGLTYWLDLASRQEDAGGDGRLRHDPDFIVERFEIRRFGEDGRLQHTLRADDMRHYPDDDTTHVLSPHLTYHREPPTFVSARAARLDGKGERVQLAGGVRVTRSGLNGKPDTVMTTESLDVFPEEETARSQSPVTIVQGRSQLAGSAMTADNAKAFYTLEGPVRGIFHRRASSSQAAPPPAAQPRAAKPRTKAKPQAQPKARS